MVEDANVNALLQLNANLVATYHLVQDGQRLAARAYIDGLVERLRQADPRRLEVFGFKAFSQNDEDGILQEIFRRIGVTSKTFVEFGVGDGRENNTVYLMAQGWRGLWIEGDERSFQSIQNGFAASIAADALRVINTYVNLDNINALIAEVYAAGTEIDLLSVDIDGNDHHILERIDTIQPRVIVVEYNAKFRPPTKWVMPFNPHHRWDGSDYFGASLCSYVDLLEPRGYRLVGTNIAGSNAFFVQSGLIDDSFWMPDDVAALYNPARYELSPLFKSGHPASINPQLGFVP